MFRVEKYIDKDESPLSFNEQLLWYSLQMDKNKTTYNEPILLELKGNLDIEYLKNAAQELIRHNEILRTGYQLIDNEVNRVVHREVEVDWKKLVEYDWQEGNYLAQVKELLLKEAEVEFQLAKPPLFRLRLYKIENQTIYLGIVIHHIISETDSFRIIVEKLFHLYDLIKKKETLPSEGVTYSDYAYWERKKFFHSKEHLMQKDYWMDKFKEKIASMDMPVVNSYDPDANEADKVWVTFTEKDLHNIKSFVQELEISIESYFLSVVYFLLYKYTGKSEILIAYPNIERKIEQTENLIGFMGNTLLIQAKMNRLQTFAELFQYINVELQNALKNSNISLSETLEFVNNENSSELKAYQVMFDYVKKPLKSFHVQDIEVIPHLEIGNKRAKSDFGFTVYEYEKELRVNLEYNKRHFHIETIKKLMDDLKYFANCIPEHKSKVITDQIQPYQANNNSLFKKNILYHNAAFKGFTNEDINTCIQDIFNNIVKQFPDKVALKTASYQFTYHELSLAAQHIARKIDELIGEDKEIVTLLFNHDALMIVSTIAILYSGRVYVPLERTFPRERHQYILNDSKASLLLTDNTNLEYCKDFCDERIPIMNVQEEIKNTDSADLEYEIKMRNSDSLAYMIYTSGSTGKPKGVMQSHRNMLHHLRVWVNSMEIGSNDNLSLLSSYGWDSAISDTFSALLTGGTLLPFDIKENGVDKLVQWLLEEKITVLHTTVPLFRTIMDIIDDDVIFDSIRMMPLGGDLTFKKDIEMYKKHFSKKTHLVNSYGSTESSTALMNLINTQSQINSPYLPMGYPVEETEVYLENDFGIQTLPYGIGEVVVHSPYVAIGYNNNVELTKKQFANNKYFTNDIGQLMPDGSLLYLNRKDNVVKIRGYRIELGEIESVLKEHELIKDAVAIANQDNIQKKFIVVYYVSSSGEDIDETILKKDLEKKLPNYMIPSYFVRINEIPLTASKKIDKNKLPKVTTKKKGTIREERSKDEEIIYQIWKDILGFDEISVEDNFFDLGGTSLLVFKVHSKLQEKYNKSVPITLLFEFTTIKKLVEKMSMDDNNVVKNNDFRVRAKKRRNARR